MDFLQKIFQWLANFWDSIPELLKDFLYWVVNTLIEIAGTLFDWVLAMLPTYVPPMPHLDDNGWPFLKTLCWLIPVGYVVQLLTVFTVAYTLLWAFGGILRKLRIIS